MAINHRAITAVAKKEFLDNLRNKWIVALTVIFIIMTIAASYMAGRQAGEAGFGGMEDTVVTILTIASFLIPIIAIMLGYSTIAAEAESGALMVVLAYPVRRIEVLLGKFIGLGCVLVFSTVLGFGTGGIMIAATVGTDSGAGYIIFIILAVLLGLIFLSASMCFSAICARRSTSLGAGVLLFFWGMIIGMIIFGIYSATGGDFGALISGEAGGMPDWMWASSYLSPVDMNQVAAMQAFGVTEYAGIQMEAPSFMSLGPLIVGHILWISVPLLFSYYFFERRDF